MSSLKRRDGFEGEKLISLPDAIGKKIIKANPILGQLFLTHIGYFPKAAYHYRDRKKGCIDNILIYCLRGKGWYFIGAKRFEVGVNQYCIIPATREHIRYGADEKDPWTIYWIHFNGKEMALFNRYFKVDLNNGPQNILFNEKGIELWHHMYKLLETGYSIENLAHVNLCLYHFIATFFFPNKHYIEKERYAKDLITATIQFMRSKIDQRLTIKDLVLQTRFSSSHFSYLFRKSTGMSPLDYFIHLKLQRACLLLQTTNRTVKNIANQLGYDDPYYFSRLFKKFMKVSPERYRLDRRA